MKGAPSLAYVNPAFHATAHVKSGWQEVIASTYEAGYLAVLHGVVTWGTMFLFDVGIGGSGSEVAIINNVLGDQGNYCGDYYAFPILIPKGTRVSVRLQQSRGGANSIWSQVFIIPIGAMVGGTNLFQESYSYGYNLADTGATALDPGGTPYTYGSYAQLVASSAKLKALSFLLGNPYNTARDTNCSWYAQLSIGGAGVEIPILEWTNYNRSGLVMRPVMTPPFPIQIPSGTRISARCKSQSGTSPQRLIDAMVIGYA